MESEKFWLTDVPHSSIRREGFPLDSISLDPGTGKYFYDLPETAVDRVAVEEGFLTFFLLKYDLVASNRLIFRIQDWQITLTAFPQITAESSGSPALTAAFVPQHFYFAGR